VIEDIKLLNERESLSGFIQIEKCLDTSEKAFQKKVLCIKVSHRFFTTTAVSDIILLSKTKRAPMGYNYIGEINNHLICIKFAQIPTGQQASVAAPPIPPRPYSMTNMQDENGFVIVNPRQPSPPQNGAGQQQQNHPQHNAATYNPLSGVPFEINPAYNFENADNRVDDIAVRVLFNSFVLINCFTAYRLKDDDV
jgi:ESCRT-I complex subunit MVB12